MKERLEQMLDSWVRQIGRGTSEDQVAELAKAIALLEIAAAIRSLAASGKDSK